MRRKSSFELRNGKLEITAVSWLGVDNSWRPVVGGVVESKSVCFRNVQVDNLVYKPLGSLLGKIILNGFRRFCCPNTI